MNTVEARRWQPDWALFLLIVALVVAGLAMIFSASSAITLDKGLSPFFFIVKQIIAAVIGFVAMRLMLTFDYKVLAEPKVYMLLLLTSIVLLIVVLFMPAINNTHRWFKLPFSTFQPSELAKVALVIALAAIAARWRDLLATWGFFFLTLAIFVTPIVFLVGIQPDLGTAIVIAISSLAVLFAGGIGIRKLIVIGVIAALGIGAYIAASPYRLERIQTFLDPTADPLGSGFQAQQSEIALGAGGVTGVGYMESRQKLFYLPESYSDFIFSVIGEEWGLLGSLLIVALYLTLFARGLRIAFTARDLLGFLLAAGITCMIVGQALLNISVAATLLPTKGIPLPLVSSGGTSLIMTMAALGLLLNVSQYCRKG